MSDARVEAERRYPVVSPDLSYPTDGVCNYMQTAFASGAEWQASRPVTDAEVEAVARVLLADYDEQYDAGSGIDAGTFESLAREALEAARKTGDNS